MNEVWNIVVDTLKNRLSDPNFQIFTNSSQPSSFSDEVLTIKVNNYYSKTWLKDKCEPIILEGLSDTPYKNIIIEYEIFAQVEPSPQLELFSHQASSLKDINPQVHTMPETTINTTFTFDNFIVGNNNRFAHAAALAVANKPANAYNPLFIYGSVGLGKTHLLHAIANKIGNIFPALRVKIVTSEKFTNDLINAIKNKKTASFKDEYRNIDVLAIDDIQFLAGKEATQEEFFHTFNELHSNNKQIVVTSDRSPKDIPTLRERLRTRFAWGLVADIQPPELETRIAILRKKMELSNVVISDEILHYIATQIPYNVRELEGALNRITAYSSLLNTEITLSMASSVIKDMIGIQIERPLTISLIKRKVADFFNIPFDDLSVKTRTKELAYARQIAMYLARELTNISLPKIGENFGNRDHSTVMHACDKIKTLIDSDTETKSIINSLITNIKSI